MLEAVGLHVEVLYWPSDSHTGYVMWAFGLRSIPYTGLTKKALALPGDGTPSL